MLHHKSNTTICDRTPIRYGHVVRAIRYGMKKGYITSVRQSTRRFGPEKLREDGYKTG